MLGSVCIHGVNTRLQDNNPTRLLRCIDFYGDEANLSRHGSAGQQRQAKRGRIIISTSNSFSFQYSFLVFRSGGAKGGEENTKHSKPNGKASFCSPWFWAPGTRKIVAQKPLPSSRGAEAKMRWTTLYKSISSTVNFW